MATLFLFPPVHHIDIISIVLFSLSTLSRAEVKREIFKYAVALIRGYVNERFERLCSLCPPTTWQGERAQRLRHLATGKKGGPTAENRTSRKV